MKRSLAPVLVLALLVAACGVNVDLSGLSFQPESVADTANNVSTDLPDLTAQGDLPGADAGPDTVEVPLSCWEVYDCLIFQEKGWDLALSKFKACGATVINEELVGPVGDLEHCLDICMLEQSIEDFAECLGAFCIAESIVCINDGSTGDKSCADALWCTVEECNATADEPAEHGLECLLDCYGGMSPGEVDELNDVVGECVKKDGGDNPGCIPAAQQCFANSGSADKSCWDVAACLQACTSCDEADPDCHPESCLVACFWGMSMEAYEQYSGLSECFTDPFANVFACLQEAVACFGPNFQSGALTDPCAKTIEKIRGIYYMPEMPFGERYDKMLGVLWKINKEHIPFVVDAFYCLEEKWTVFPGYGAMPQGQFEDCASTCP
jgi:hypothetical protein